MDDLALLSRPVCEQLADAVRETVNPVSAAAEMSARHGYPRRG
jgi:hypothetical protein